LTKKDELKKEILTKILTGKLKKKSISESEKKVDHKQKVKVKPYREILLADGHGLLIKTTCSVTTDKRIQVIQYRESPDPEGTRFMCTEPNYFENKLEFLEWLSNLIKNHFDEIPYITISPLEETEIKKHERESTDIMYL
jgi:hypothetical protein